MSVLAALYFAWQRQVLNLRLGVVLGFSLAQTSSQICLDAVSPGRLHSKSMQQLLITELPKADILTAAVLSLRFS